MGQSRIRQSDDDETNDIDIDDNDDNDCRLVEIGCLWRRALRREAGDAICDAIRDSV